MQWTLSLLRLYLPTNSLWTLLLLIPTLCGTQLEAAGRPATVELKTAEKTHVGTPLAHGEQICWLNGVDGSVVAVHLDEVTSFRKVSDRFRPMSIVQMREKLRTQYRGIFEVQAAGDYVVCGPPGRTEGYALLLSDVQKSFSRFFNRRRFEIESPEFPLVVIVFESRDDFVMELEKTRDNIPDTLRGTYDIMSNRVYIYERDLPTEEEEEEELAQLVSVTSQVSPGFKSTLIHEAVHQLAYNTGVHHRVGISPRWVVEGLAMLLEVEEVLYDSGRSSPKDRINNERLQHYIGYRDARPDDALKPFIAGDTLFAASPLDAYSEAWALSFFLAESEPTAYGKYLREMAKRDPLKPYSAEERQQDFEAVFGSSYSKLEFRYRKFITGMK